MRATSASGREGEGHRDSALMMRNFQEGGNPTSRGKWLFKHSRASHN